MSRTPHGDTYVKSVWRQAVVCHQSGRLSDAVELYGLILDAEPDHLDALNLGGVAAFQSGDDDTGLRRLRKAVALKPNFAEAHSNLGGVLVDQGDREAAIRCFRRAVEIDPGLPDYHANLGITLHDAGQLHDALIAFDACLTLDPGNTHALSFKTNVLLALDERDAVAVLVDFDRFIRRIKLSPPSVFSNVSAYNRTLAEQASTHSTLMAERPGRTTRLGAQSDNLLVGAEGPLGFLEEIIRSAVETYRCELPYDPVHPFIAARPQAYTLTAWATVLEQGGHQDPHTHPNGWLSGVYYVKVPDLDPDDPESADEHAGWIEFGRPDPRFYPGVEAEVKLIRPEEGLIVLFPSYFWHRTVPTESTDQRISIAFDVIPAARFE